MEERGVDDGLCDDEDEAEVCDPVEEGLEPFDAAGAAARWWCRYAWVGRRWFLG